jgi:hypothetical protein
MFLYVLIFFIYGLNLASDPFSSAVVVHHEALAARSSSLSEDELCDMALSTFMRRTDSDITRYVKPHLVSAIKEAVSSPESDDEGVASASSSPSPKRVIKTWVKQPESVKSTPRPELDEIILSAVQKAFEEKEAALEHKSKKIEGMFSKKTTTLITTCVGAIIAIVSSLGSVYGTMGNVGNCTK